MYTRIFLTIFYISSADDMFGVDFGSGGLEKIWGKIPTLYAFLQPFELASYI
jgi:hypothetical protein